MRQARPEAVSHLLQFFKESGRNLEPKTRFLISIVTKVINFSPRGLRQYVRRAMEEGASADEVLDAVMCAYPCAGLTRVVDAIDVILALDIPEFEALAGDKPSTTTAETATPRWVEVGELEEFGDSGRLHVRVGDRDLALFLIDGSVFAIDNLCPHRGGPLVRGHLEGDTLRCPLHHWSFNVRTGQSVDHPGARVGCYQVRLEDTGRVLVRIE